jgi:PAS domain S-box-containing protein
MEITGKILSLAKSGSAPHLIRTLRLLESMIDSSIDGILAFDHQCRYTIWNPAMEKISGKSKSECLGKVAFEVFPFLRTTGEDEFLRMALQGQVNKVTERPFEIPETGKSGFFEAVYSPIFDENQKVTGGFAVIREITERVIAQKALLESELKYRSLTQFANDAIIS